MSKNWSERVILGLTGETEKDWRDKIAEINELKVDRIGLFLEFYEYNQRQPIYSALKKSGVKEIPFVHIRHDMEEDELAFIEARYNKPLMNFHESRFEEAQEKWPNYLKKGIQIRQIQLSWFAP